MEGIQTTCETCEGRRFKDDVLTYTWRGKSITDVLDMTVREAIAFFDEIMPSFRIDRQMLTLDQLCSLYTVVNGIQSTMDSAELTELLERSALSYRNMPAARFPTA